MMKLFNVKLTTLKSKLYAIVFASFVVRVVAFFALPNNASNLAPDEGQYAYLVEWVSQGKPVSEYPLFGPNLYYSARSIIWPSTLFYHLGFDSLDSIRIVSSTYGLLIAMLIAMTINKVCDRSAQAKSFCMKNQYLLVILLFAITFTPSHFVWSVLGLRESAVEFWTILTFNLIFFLFYLKVNISPLTATLYLFSIVMLYSSRPQVGIVLSTVLILYIFLKIKSRNAQILMPITIVAVFLGALLCSTPSTPSTPWTPSTPSTPSTPQDINPINRILSQVENLFYHHQANQVEAGSAIATAICPFAKSFSEGGLACLVWRTPYSVSTFLFRPVLGSDTTSTSSLFAGIENIIWLTAFLFVSIMYIRNRRFAFFSALLPSLLFFSIYIVAAGAYEGNMGTAFRHKSLILWVVLLLIASTIVATEQRKAEQQGISGSSQE